MSIITVADVQAALPGIGVTTTSTPSTDDVARFIAMIESQIQALVGQFFIVWPTDPASAPALFLKQTILEGVKAETLKATFATVAGQNVPASVAWSIKAYADLKSELGDMARAMRQANPDSAGGVTPQVLLAPKQPMLSGSFDEYSRSRDLADQWRRWNSGRFWPWR